ncbi:hypothetical protein A2866_05065 [Candidatus Roizmanbacteria bacterium RIFCSPHIGHO2_01_FULL_39_8]|uniref:Calcineurin-like phosphoesterase domain-containing protein n=2 Tax=Candidatus Roizmaniibacteriota TaxID=1752723 RepID=A0A1F7GH86_9BACT|nr:MAG: hypothetical protein A2866_05065 [Candidatus Roizmanbacteria bacterium RIFCSPHIGHO2_01_FULL_39_8]OGK37622.1 MAG: hypothetical protein A3F60_01885 [Candidatus Roizmanbacteria bacterium RIFCSPHIGHO2_12_FULL_39_8]
MKILVFSDTHLTHTFEPNKFELLKKIILKADRVIINGDFWDGYRTTFDTFIASDWKRLFPLLKSKKTVYLFGNHDRKSFMDKRMRLFSDTQSETFILRINGKNFIFEHGNRISPLLDESPLMPHFLNRITTRIAGFALKNISFLQFLHKRMNVIIKSKMEKRLKRDDILLCGHSHYPEIDLKHKFVNSGYIQNGKAHYLIIEEGKIIAKKEFYPKT